MIHDLEKLIELSKEIEKIKATSRECERLAFFCGFAAGAAYAHGRDTLDPMHMSAFAEKQFEIWKPEKD